VSVIDSTLSGNQANSLGGAIKLGDQNSLTVRDSTIARNQATQGGGGLYVPGTGGSTVVSSVALTNTILAANTTISGGADCQDPQGVTDGGHNLIGALDSNCPGITAGVNGNQAGTPASPLDPGLGQLAGNGGPTQTLALLASSPAIAAGDPTDCQTSPVNSTTNATTPATPPPAKLATPAPTTPAVTERRQHRASRRTMPSRRRRARRPAARDWRRSGSP
jgi:hypothetical protein